MSKKFLGCDLGSSNSCVAIIENGKPVVVVNEEGGRTTPSVVFLKDGERKIGASAKRQQIVNPKHTVNFIKRMMGATYEESKKAIDHVQYDVVNQDNFPRVKIDDRLYSPEEISSMILLKMKKIAEDYVGEEIKDAVITVPAFFNDSARAATKTAGELVGLNVLRIISEPVAALLASKIDMQKGSKYLVTDFGGLTLDNSVADIADGVVEILATNGDVYLGGGDIDKIIADHLVETFKNKEGIDLTTDSQAYARIFEAAEKAKIELSNSPSTDINLPYITIKDGTPIHFNHTLTKAKFEQLIDPIITRVVDLAKEAVKQSKLEYKDLDGILLVGGSCRIPAIQAALEKEFGIPLNKSLNLDEAVAEGAAIQGNIILGGEGSQEILLLDVTPLNLGIETLGGVMTTLIEGNTTIPCKKEEVFSTAADNQPSVEIRVLNGNRPMAKDNKEIGRFILDGIMPAPKQVPKIKVTFSLDANSILTVSAVDEGTNKEQHITIQTKGVLTSEEIERIKREAEEHAEEDKKEKELADAVNMGDSIVFQNEKLLKEHDANLSEDEKKEFNELLDKMRKAVQEKNKSDIESVAKEIQEKWNGIATRIYSQTKTEEQPTANADASTDDNIQDVEAEEVNP